MSDLPEHLRGDGPCARCGTEDHPVWFTDSVFWNAVVRSRPLPWTEGDGLMCLNCFVRLTDERGFYPGGWRVTPEWRWETDDQRETRDGRQCAVFECPAPGTGFTDDQQWVCKRHAVRP